MSNLLCWSVALPIAGLGFPPYRSYQHHVALRT